MKKLLLSSILLSMFIFAACDDNTTGTNNNNSSMTKEKFLSDYPALYCTTYQTCCAADNNWPADEDFTDYDSCVANMVDEISVDFDSTRVSVNEAKLGEFYNAASNFYSTSCDATTTASDYDALYAALDGLFVGLQNEGDECEGSDECSSNLYCMYDENDNGTCATYVALGGDCSNDERCVEGTHCKTVDATNEVSECVTNLIVGDDCDDLDSMPNCYSGENLYCDTNTNKCATLKAAGSACESFDECESYECTDNLCVANEEDYGTLEENICPSTNDAIN